MIIVIMVESASLRNLINNMYSDQPTPLSRNDNRRLFKQVQDMLEARAIVDHLEDDPQPPDIEDMLQSTLDDLFKSVLILLNTHALIAILPVNSNGDAVLVFERGD